MHTPQLIQERGIDDLKYAVMAEKAATFMGTGSQSIDWHRARTYWEIAARWYKKVNDDENSQKSLIQASETYVKEAEMLPENYPQRSAIAASHVQSAIEAYRKISNTEQRRRELHKLLLSYQKESANEFGAVSAEFDISKMVNDSINLVKGKGLYEALISLAFYTTSPTKQSLREQAETQIKDHGLLFAISNRIVDSQGKTIAKRASFGQGSDEEIIRSQMLRLAVQQQDLIAIGVVLPAIRQINLESYFEEKDFFQFVTNNPFIPLGRETVFARGLCAGLRGDMLVSMHLLIPQVENSIRYILQNAGCITSGLDNDQIQDEHTLQKVLYRQELENIFGEDLLFDLQGVLVERFGSNFRNLIAHGLLEAQHFDTAPAVYLWWLILRLCCLPIYSRFQIHEEGNNGGITRGVESTPGICGGDPRIAGTRIPVWVLVQYRKLGTSESEILRAYPTLRAEDLANAWAYYHGHKAEIDAQILENEAD